MAKLLLVDDDTEVLEINQKYLAGEGHAVYTESNPLKVPDLVKKIKPDCMVIDVMMPEMDGFELCQNIRRFSTVPIIFLTGKSDEDDKINGLVKGGDDYIVKPYSLRELKARIDVLLRRNAGRTTAPVKDDSKLTFGDLVIDKISHLVTFEGEEIPLAKREYEVLFYMATHPDKDVTFEELGIALFGTYIESDRRSVMVNMSRLRKKFEDYPELEDIIETVWSKGYRFNGKK